jgi:hypothetical protein
MTIDPLDAIHQGLWSENKSAKVSILDTAYIPQNKIFSINSLVKEFGISTKSYSGVKGFLASGIIFQ